MGSPHSGVSTSFFTDGAGIRFIYATTWMNDSSWTLVVRQEVGDAFAPLRRTTVVGVLILVVGAVAIVLLAHSLTNLTIKRIRQADEEKSRMGQQLIVASRLAEIGEMSAGFAHEINNPLQIIRSEQTLIDTILDDLSARGELPESDDMREVRSSVDQIRQQVDRCGSITQGILKFARHGEPTVRTIRLWEFIPEVVAMVAQQAAVNGIHIRTDVADTSCRVNADPGQVQQVLLNLLNNAFDAVISRHGAGGGEVWMEAERICDDITISVRDNGRGISPDILDKVFTPFFTTKPVGHGTGLGLPVCFGIVDALGGTIRISSEENRGTTCLVTLPAAA